MTITPAESARRAAGARRAAATRRAARIAELASQPLTADSVREVGKLTTTQTPVVAIQVAPGSFRLRLRYEGKGDNARRLLSDVRNVFIQHGHDAAVNVEQPSGDYVLTVVEGSEEPQPTPVVELADVDRAFARLGDQARYIEELSIKLANAEAAYRELEHEAITAQAIYEGWPLPEPGESAADWSVRIHTSDD